MKWTCAQCRYFNPPRETETLGECHRHAPMPTTYAVYLHFPRIAPTNWCGDFGAAYVMEPAKTPPRQYGAVPKPGVLVVAGSDPGDTPA